MAATNDRRRSLGVGMSGWSRAAGGASRPSPFGSIGTMTASLMRPSRGTTDGLKRWKSVSINQTNGTVRAVPFPCSAACHTALLIAGPTVKRGISGIEQAPGFGITARGQFLVGEKHQKIGIVIRTVAGFDSSPSKLCQLKVLEDGRRRLGGRTSGMNTSRKSGRWTCRQILAFTGGQAAAAGGIR
jgi:hypothetical protein